MDHEGQNQVASCTRLGGEDGEEGLSMHRTPGRDGQVLGRYNYLTWPMVAREHHSG